MIKVPGFEEGRILVVGKADTEPLVPNTSLTNRRKNRRVEIAIMQGKAKLSEELQVAQ